MSNQDIPLWIRRSCALWGHQKRRIWSGRDWHGNVDGYAQSLLGRIKEERDGASQGRHNQHWPEVFTGDGLEVQRAVLQRKMSERARIVLTFQFVWDPQWQVSAERKAELIGIARSTYFADLKLALGKIHKFLESDSQSDDSVREILVKLITAELQKHRIRPISVATLPALSLEALERSTLSRPKS